MNSNKRPIGVFDLTSECPLRCRHCYFYTDVDNIPADLEEDDFLARLEETRDAYGIRSAFWIGGEPLHKPELLRRSMALFPRNAVSTSGALPIPDDLDAGLLVSIEGCREAHDTLRGEGAFNLAMEHVRELEPKTFALSTTLAASNVDTIHTLPEVLEQSRALGILVGFHVGRPDDPERLSPERRDQAVDELLELHDRHPGVLLNSRESIELFRSCHNAEISKHCIYRDKAIAFDVHLKVKEPCTFAENASCNACGCPVVYTHAGWQADDGHSEGLLHALFPKRDVVGAI
jgi:MoaA/NifB/PqqE/SkfB family radical SAM enzyme